MRTTKPPQTADDGPAPERMTPRRLAARIHAAAEDLARVRLRLRSLAPYLAGAGRLRHAADAVAAAEAEAVELGADVRVGRVELVPDLVDGASVPERPLLDAIDARRIDRRLSDGDRGRIVERGDADPEWVEVITPEPEEPEEPEAEAEAPKAKRKPPRHSYAVAVRDPHGNLIALGGLAVPARNLVEARCYAGEAYGGGEYRDSRGVHRTVAEADLVVSPAPKPTKAQRKRSSRAKPVTNGTIAADQWTEEHTAAVRDGFAAVRERFQAGTKGGGT